MDNFIKVMDEAMVQLCNCSELVEKMHRDYGCGFEMSPRDIHLLEVVKNHPEMNASELAEKIGLQKGTFSKVVHRLEKTGLLYRHQNEDNRKEVFFKLTELGQRAYDGHYQFHERTSPASYEYFQQYTEEEQQVILEFIRHYTNYLKEYLK